MRKALYALLKKYGDDVLTLSGIAVIVYAAFLFNRLAGLFALGVALILAGYLVAQAPERR